ncbi:MAG: EH signature domain-containing protein, partial [Aeromonas sp.]
MKLFNPPKIPTKNKLNPGGSTQWQALTVNGAERHSFPLKTLMQLVQLVEQGRLQEITLLEWLQILQDKLQWHALSRAEELQACNAVWVAINSAAQLQTLALFKIALSVEGKEQQVVESIVRHMALAHTIKGLTAPVAEKIAWLSALQDGDQQKLATICYEKQATIAKYIANLGFPNANGYLDSVTLSMLDCLEQGNISKIDDDWLYENYLEIKTEINKLEFLNKLIQQQGQFDYGVKLGKLVYNNCLPDKESSYWKRLSQAAKNILKKKFQLSSYSDLSKVLSCLCDRELGEKLQLDEKCINNIQARSEFWSNYSQKIIRTRILLPASTFAYVDENTKGKLTFIDKLDLLHESEQHEPESEVYIFEFDTVIIVEFLRGRLSETIF